MKAFIAALFVASITLGAYPVNAYFFPGHPECPWAKRDHTWAKFLNGEYGGTEPFFSIRFTRDIADLEGGRCYTVNSLGNELWSTSGKIRTKRPYTSKNEKSRGGNPLKYEMSIWTLPFTFNEAGEVFFAADGKLAGHMYCHIGSECWK